MKKHAATSHQSGGRHAYLPINSPRANAIAAHSKGARAAGDIAAICAGPPRLPKAVKCLTRRNAGAKAGVDTVGKVGLSSFVYLRALCGWIVLSNHEHSGWFSFVYLRALCG
jgi:hypothetical protein